MYASTPARLAARRNQATRSTVSKTRPGEHECRRNGIFFLFEVELRVRNIVSTAVRILFQTPPQRAYDGQWCPGRKRIPFGLGFENIRQRVRHVFANECRLPREHFVEHGAKCPDVAALVGRLAARLLGTHVCGGAKDDAHLRERRTGQCWRLRHAGRRHIVDHGFRQTEVEHLHRAIRPAFDVRWF